MPTNLHCDNITDRLTLVSKHDSSVGELEIQATANMLRKTIIVVNEQFDNINVYNDLYNRHIDNCITLRFLQLGEYVGHYEAILPDVACRVSVNKCTKPHDIIPVPRKSPTIQIRKRRCKLHLYSHTDPIRQSLKQRQHKRTRSGGSTTGPLGPGPQAPSSRGPPNHQQTIFRTSSLSKQAASVPLV